MIEIFKNENGRLKRNGNVRLAAMGYRHCGKCKLAKPESEFGIVSGKISHYCTECRREIGRDYIKRKYARDGGLKHKSWELKEKILNHLGAECVFCGYNKFQSVLEFHHIEKRKQCVPDIILKIVSTTGDVRQGHIDALQEEMLRCILLCANCHIAWHRGQLSPSDEYVEQKRIKRFDVEKLLD